tara:strand:+ start:1538 stop:2242 length:705 start_codon:yes stop_codon:yes gene_type:complete
VKKGVAIITARGGSKRIPGKNIKNFLGKPLISYSIEAALQSELFEEVMVSTDSEEIAEIAKKSGAQVPFLRSNKNSDDYSGTADVLLEVLKAYQKEGKTFDHFCCIYPTAPFVTAQKLKDSHKLFQEQTADFCVTVTEYSYPVQRRLSLKESGEVFFTCPEYLTKRSQDLEKQYHDVGQIYWGQPEALEREKYLFGGKCVAFVVPPLEAQDIDQPEDWELAEFKYRFLKDAGRI